MAESRRKGFLLAGLLGLLNSAPAPAGGVPTFAPAEPVLEEAAGPDAGAHRVELGVHRRLERSSRPGEVEVEEIHFRPTLSVPDGVEGTVMVGDQDGISLNLGVTPTRLTERLISLRLKSGNDPRGVRVLARPGETRTVDVPDAGHLEVEVTASAL